MSWANLAAAAERVVTDHCRHCGGSRFCPVGCDECRWYQHITQSQLCGACQGTGLLIGRVPG